MTRPWRRAAALIAASFLTACTHFQAHEQEIAVPPAEMAQYLDDKPPEARRLYAQVLIQGKRNAALNHMRAGLAALYVGALPTAADSFDQALAIIEAIYADTPEAEKARSLWFKENVKDFKGDSYERAMAYYYRGLLYLMADDYQNARASFRGGILQTTYAEQERYRANFATLSFLEGWAARCAGQTGLAGDAFAEAGRLRTDLTTPPADHDLLMIAETGRGPIKRTTGKNQEQLYYSDSLVKEQSVRFALAGTPPITARAPDSLFYQATTRGGREIDVILAGKAQFKDATKTTAAVTAGAGVGLLAAGTLNNNNKMQAAGLAVLLVGALVNAAADAMHPTADTRYWDNLPNVLHFATARQMTAAARPSVPAGKSAAGKAPAAKPPADVPIEQLREAAKRLNQARTDRAAAERALAKAGAGNSAAAAAEAKAEAERTLENARRSERLAEQDPALQLTSPDDPALVKAGFLNDLGVLIETRNVPVRGKGACRIAWTKIPSPVDVPDKAPNSGANAPRS